MPIFNAPGTGGLATREATAHDSLGNRLTKVGAVLSPSTVSGAFDQSLVESLFVGRDPLTGKLAGVYTGYSGAIGAPGAGSIGLAYSDDGVYWQKYPTAIMGPSGVTGDPDFGTCTGPTWVYDNGTFYMFYIGASLAGYEAGVKSLCLATAPALTGPWTRLGQIIGPSGSGWRQTAVWHPSVLKHNGTWYMFFNASSTGTAEQIGYATATALTGPWTVDDTNSPLLAFGSATSGEFTKQGDPSVRRVGDLFVMDYFGFKTGFAGDYIATTPVASFPLGWTKWKSNPVLVPGPAGSIDSLYAHKPIIYVERGRVFHYYTADDGTNRCVALAVSADVPTTSAYTVKDRFNRADAGTIGTAETGQVWTSGTGWAIVSNVAKFTGTADANILLDSGISDNFALRFKTTAVTGQYPVAIQLRYTDATHYFKIFKNNDAWKLDQSGAVSFILAAGGTLSSGDHIEVQVRGKSVVLLVNDAVQASAILSSITTATTHGVGGSANIGLQVDDFTIRPL